ncbi:lycopene cyclase domain-containing protein [Mycetocola zhadangensis]|uniref:Lycopene cyclase domain-containing protein n=1 Tax=Mycetocola zhadangensis TaxID=1164595 RepID=A0A3L7J619_9MICO|nr:lycopene cyclase domain-containing protein [Mycetocola zhadangensis]RLQ86158.1 lycopene cyclase domain-containing protein [Mycetocola zhadangensis]GGE88871.1 lycopene cyclase [Mycetocola zhadangensis]
MTYWLLNLVFLVPALVIGLSGAARAQRATPHQRPFARMGLTLVVVLVMTAIFDNLMIAVGLFGYNPDRISGLFLGLAPLEDFAYAIAASILLPGLWLLLPAKKAEGAR